MIAAGVDAETGAFTVGYALAVVGFVVGLVTWCVFGACLIDKVVTRYLRRHIDRALGQDDLAEIEAYANTGDCA